MTQIIIHIGAPRTGTTTLQAHLFKYVRKYIVLTKRPYAGSIETTNPGKSTGSISPNELIRLLSSIEETEECITKNTFFANAIIHPSLYCAHNPTINNNKKLYEPLLKEALTKAITSAGKTDKNIFISSERLSDTGASLLCYSTHNQFDWLFPAFPLCDITKEINSQQPLISACLRSPVSYLKSKYMRTFAQRRTMRGERDLSPTEYIQKQCTLETNHPGTSALTPAMHAEFIKQLQKHAFVKAFGFQELLASDDVFSLMGLQGEEKYAFRDFPRENKLPFSKEQEQTIEIEITQALNQYSFYDRIMKSQMFE